mmetsp:Transcript_27404/g.60685  ORF Transcript_27404/g.60685 Transcript_27404/m.60685 type:complete len:265 (-) Transcript_27404:835-1629(-)
MSSSPRSRVSSTPVFACTSLSAGRGTSPSPNCASSSSKHLSVSFTSLSNLTISPFENAVCLHFRKSIQRRHTVCAQMPNTRPSNSGCNTALRLPMCCFTTAIIEAATLLCWSCQRLSRSSRVCCTSWNTMRTICRIASSAGGTTAASTLLRLAAFSAGATCTLSRISARWLVTTRAESFATAHRKSRLPTNWPVLGSGWSQCLVCSARVYSTSSSTRHSPSACRTFSFTRRMSSCLCERLKEYRGAGWVSPEPWKSTHSATASS